MPIERLTVSCLEELLAKVGEWKSKADKIYLFFCGDKDKATGESWCPDCVKGVCNLTLQSMVQLSIAHI